MLFELRQYRLRPGQRDNWVRLMEEAIIPFQSSQGMVIGRAADQCDLVVAHATVSRRHARLSLAGDALQVEDLGSTNGTAIGGKALGAGAPVVLHAGNKLRLGDVELLVRQL